MSLHNKRASPIMASPNFEGVPASSRRIRHHVMRQQSTMKDFKHIAIKSIHDPLFTEANEIYTQSFPLHEQRDIPDLEKILDHPDFHYDAILTSKGRVAAILCSWITSDFVYLEHLAVSSDMRNGGFGKIILDKIKQNMPAPVILEIDPIENEISQRRLGFYERNGFIANYRYDYIHPPYKQGDASYPLLVMSYPAELSPELFSKFETYHHTIVVNAEQ